MNFDVYEKDNSIIVDNVNDFELKHIFDCGQCFRWNEEEDGSFTGVVKNKVANINKIGNKLIISNSNIEDFYNMWIVYLDLGRNYGDIKASLSEDTILNQAIKFGEGIRILKQDEWEILISFIISANNRIPMIKRAVDKISRRWGEKIYYNGKEYYTFPSADILSKVTIDELEECSVGFRAKYIKNTAMKVANKDIDLYKIKEKAYEEAKRELIKFDGVGPKVADCILLYSMAYFEAFPVDVWVKRVMQYYYLNENVSLKKIGEFAREKFKDLSGFAQQYLFYYARLTKTFDKK